MRRVSFEEGLVGGKPVPVVVHARWEATKPHLGTVYLSTSASVCVNVDVVFTVKPKRVSVDGQVETLDVNYTGQFPPAETGTVRVSECELVRRGVSCASHHPWLQSQDSHKIVAFYSKIEITRHIESTICPGDTGPVLARKLVAKSQAKAGTNICTLAPPSITNIHHGNKSQ